MPSSDRSVSRTALGVAYLRAAHQLLEQSPRILEDPLALTLFGHDAEARIRAAEDYYQRREQRALRSTVALRSRYTEDRLHESLSRGVVQYILLGAGFDTFALRQPEWARSLQIIEVDHSGTQEFKRELISSAHIDVPNNVTFAAVDFERETLLERLVRIGVRATVPTFFSWMGVTMYLPSNAIDATLQSIASFPAGSELVLTFAPPHSDYKSPFESRAAEVGEPWISFFTNHQIEAKLKSFGLAGVTFLSQEEANELYYKNRPQDLDVPRRTNIVAAIRCAQ